MTHQVRLEDAAARPLAAISTTASPDQLGPVIIATLDRIWPVLRSQGVRTGHNVVIYRGLTRRVYGDWEDDPAKRRTEIYLGIEFLAVSVD